jgi:uncharacterized protein
VTAAGAAPGPAARREPLIDALRALALLGVLVVNAISYPGGPSGSPLGMPMPADSNPAVLLFGLVAWLVQGKAYPMLAFLFGYSLAMALRRQGPAARDYRGRRLLRMLVLGVLHGTLLYAGDILTMYAVAGLVVLRSAQQPLRRLIVVWRLFGVLALVIVAMNVTLLLTSAPGDVGLAGGPGYATTTGMPDFLRLNAPDYLGTLPVSLALFLPEVLMLMLAGFIAGRLRWLTHPRWGRARQALVRRVMPVALLLNLIYAIFMVWAVLHDSPWQWAGLSMEPPAGWLLSAALGSALAAGWQVRHAAWLQAIVPLGRYSLSVYVGHSLLCALVLSGAGLGWRAGTLGLVGWAVGLWLLCAAGAAWAARRRWPGPLEAWMARA